MIHQPILINGEWRDANFPVSSFKAVSPASGKQLPDSFPVSSFLDLDEMLQADENERGLIEKCNFGQRADFLELVAAQIENSAEELCQTANAETGLEKTFLLEKELANTTANLRLAASYCRNRTWREANIDTRNNIRSIRMPLSGPVVIFGPADQPFVLNSCGGTDFACAIAAGNSVIAKSNPNHPLTCMKLAQIIHAASQQLKLPACIFQFFFNTTNDLGYRLAAHPMIGALAFSGTRRSGLALKENTDRAGNLGYFALSGLNPVFLLPAVISEKKTQLSKDICSSVLLNDGQSCNKPGLIFLVENKDSSTLIKSVVEEFNLRQSRPLLTDLIARALDTLVTNFIRHGARKLTRKEFYQPNPFVYPNTVLHIDAKTWLKFAVQFQEEAFGPVLIFVTLENESQFESIIKTLEGCRSASIYSQPTGPDQLLYANIARLLRRKTGRLINDRLPTTLTNSPAQVSGGIFPASGHPGFTASGLPAAIKRFSVLQCFDQVSQDRLPEDLGDRTDNNTMIRLIDDTYQQSGKGA